MIRKKLLWTSILLAATPALVFALGTPETFTQNLKSQQAATRRNIAIEQTYADTTPSVEIVSFCDRAMASLYAGFGATILNDKGATDLMPKAYAGYGTFIGKSKIFYSALELSAGAISIALSPNQQYRVSSLIAASVIPGVRINDWSMLYARLGAQSTHYSNLNSTRSGGLYGLGIEVLSSKHWDTRFEYSYANNKNLNQFDVDTIYKFK